MQYEFTKIHDRLYKLGPKEESTMRNYIFDHNLHTPDPAPMNATVQSSRVWQTPTILTIDSLGNLERGKHYLLIGRRRWNFVEMPDGDFRFIGGHTMESEILDAVDKERVFSQSELEALVNAGMLYVDHPTMVLINPKPGAHTR